MKKILFIVFLFAVLSSSVHGQITGLSFVEYQVHTSGELNNYTTWRLYANLTNPTDRINSVYGLSTEPAFVNTTGNFWHSPFAPPSQLGNMNCALIAPFPTLQWDSYVTINVTCSSQPCQVFALQSSEQPWQTVFGSGLSFAMDDVIGGSWFLTPTDPCTEAGASLQILIGQFTVPTGSVVNGCLNFQVFPNYSGPGSSFITQSFCFANQEGIVYGCTNPAALNYDPAATVDNGLCLLPCALVVANQSVVHPSCSYSNNGTIDIDGAGNQGFLQYTMTGAVPNGTGVFSNLGNGSYTITLDDQLFNSQLLNPGGIYGTCQITTTVQLNTPPVVLTQQSVSNVTCFGAANGTATFNVSGGTQPITYTLVNNQGVTLTDGNGNNIELNSPSYNQIPPGTWKFVATDANGCVFNNAPTFNITQPFALFIQVNAIIPPSCADSNNGQVIISYAGGTGTPQFQIEGLTPWSTSTTITNVPGGSYILKGKDANGCEASVPISVPTPTPVVVTAATVATSCDGGADACVTLVGSGGNQGSVYTYSMDGVNYTSNSQFCGYAAGTYTTYAKTQQGCEGQGTVTVTSPLPVTSSAAVINANCFGDSNGSITLTTSGGTFPYSYTLNGNPVSTFINNLPAGNYTIMIQDANNCPGEVSATITEPSELTLSGMATNALCFGQNGSVSLTANGGSPNYFYTFNGNFNTSGNFNNVQPGTYNASVEDSHGCAASVSGITVTQPTQIGITVDGFTNETSPNANNGTISISVTGGTPGYTYSWTNSNGTQVSTSQDPQNLAPGQYTVVVTDANGCTMALGQNITIQVDVAEFDNAVKVTLYPNPNAGIFSMNLSGLSGQRVFYQLNDARGRVVVAEEMGQVYTSRTENFDLTEIESGVYFLLLNVDGATKTFKVIKQ